MRPQTAMPTLSLLVLMLFICDVTLATVVETPFGKLQGAEVKAKNNQNFWSFTGIPYAKPPVGQLRFAKPEPHPPLDGIFDATKQSPYCRHPSDLILMAHMPAGQEDCLFLNVYVKHLGSGTDIPTDASVSKTTTTNKQPVTTGGAGKKKVLVWVHGGGYSVGGSRDVHAGAFVTTQDVIVVTVNYRLGVLGFLSTGDESAPGNYGLWDQVMAIRWVKENIAAFGGDPDGITIAGVSAGGTSVSFLSVSPATRGLFTRVFAMSGTATSSFATDKDAVTSTLEIARSNGCLQETDEGGEVQKLTLAQSEKIINCLRDLPVEEATKFSSFRIDKSHFVPRVDGDLVPLHASQLLKNDEYLESIGFFNRTYLFGLANNEKGILDVWVEMTEAFFLNMENKTDEEKAEMVEDFHKTSITFNTGSRLDTHSLSRDLIDKITTWYGRRLAGQITSEVVTDLNFLIPTYDFLYTLARSKTTDAYLLYFNHFPAFLRGKYRGMFHGIDPVFWLDMDFDLLEQLLHAGIMGDMDQEDLEIKAKFSDVIGQFIISGNPWNGLQEELPGGWPTFDLSGQHYLDFSSKPAVKRHLEREKRDLWMTSVPEWVAATGGSSLP